jgi:inosine-uridine nucleoside N-ribohydrolase
VAASEFFGHGLSLRRLKTIPAREVFGSGLSIHLVPLDATRKVLWRRADLTVWNSFTSEEGALAARLLNWMLDSWQSDNIYIWDLVAAIHATNTAICPETPLAVDIVIAPGPEQGRMLVTDDTENVDVCLDPDPEQVKALAASILGR